MSSPVHIRADSMNCMPARLSAVLYCVPNLTGRYGWCFNNHDLPACRPSLVANKITQSCIHGIVYVLLYGCTSTCLEPVTDFVTPQPLTLLAQFYRFNPQISRHATSDTTEMFHYSKRSSACGHQPAPRPLCCTHRLHRVLDVLRWRSALGQR